MGELVLLDRVREARSERAMLRAPVRFFFDPAHPLCYVLIERIERMCGDIEWVPAFLPPAPEVPEVAERMARRYGIPLVWPERLGSERMLALRACSFAQEAGAGARFAVACARLCFAGGFDLDDPHVLMEAAAAAGLDPREVLMAAEDESRDEGLLLTSLSLRDQGVIDLPALRLADGRWYPGVEALEWSPLYGGSAHGLAG